MKNRTLSFITKSFVIIALMAIGVTSKAQTYYVFMYSNHFMTSGIEYAETFVPNTCVWVCANQLDNNTSRALYSYGSNTTYLRGTTTNGDYPTTGNSEERWRKNGDYLLYRNSNDFYLAVTLGD